MNPSFKITGINELMAKLRHAGDTVPDKARKTMRRGADKIVKEAKLNAPVDTQALEDSIRWDPTYEYRGRLSIEIKVGGTVEVDFYAMRVHESYDLMEAAGVIEAGKGTKAKRLANPGRHIGGKFLERAVQEQEEKLQKSMVEAVAVAIKEENF